MAAVIRVQPEVVLGEVSRLLYGHFMENLANIVYDGVWAEMLYGRKFESPMVHRLRHEMASPWEPFLERSDHTTFQRAALPLGRYASPHARAHHSQSISVDAGHDGSERGIAQPEIRIEEGREYVFRGRVRRLGAVDQLRVALRAADGETPLAEALVPLPEITRTRVGGPEDLHRLWMDDLSWSELGCRMRATGSDLGWLSLTFCATGGEPAMVWFDWVSLMPTDHLDGLEPRVVDALAKLPVSLLKWPGGCMADNYDWRLGIGSRDSRYPAMDQAWLAWDENDFGTDEFLRLCHLVGAEPFLCVNAGSGTPELAAAWVEYVNGPVDSEWGGIRAENGRVDPYSVRYWCVGNEQWGFFERGHAGARDYARRYRRFAAAMRKIDPSVVLAAVGQPGQFDLEVLEEAGEDIQLLSIHQYLPEFEPGDSESATRKILSAKDVDNVLRQVGEEVALSPGTSHVRIAYDEWGWARGTHCGALFAACVLNACHRAAPLVELGARACVVNVDGLVTRDGTVVRTEPVYQTFRLYGEGHRALAVECAIEHDELVDASALRDPSGEGLTLFVVNAAPQEHEVRVEVPGIRPGARVHADLLIGAAGDPWADSEIQSWDAAWEGGAWVLPAHSLTVLRVG